MPDPKPSISFENEKAALLHRMTIRQNTFMMGLASLFLLQTDAMKSLEEQSVYFQGNHIQFNSKELDDLVPYEKNDFNILLSAWRSREGDDIYSKSIVDFARSQRRTFLTESYELLNEFIKKHNLRDKLRPFSWFHYARIIRNSMSHDYRLSFHKFDHQFLPLTWYGNIIDSSMEGVPLDAALLTPTATLRLHLEMRTWIEAC